MNHQLHKFYILVMVFVLMVVGVTVASQFDQFSMGSLNIALSLVNSLLILVILGNIIDLKGKKK